MLTRAMLAQARHRSAQHLWDDCSIERIDETALDESTGHLVGSRTLVWRGPGQLTAAGGEARQADQATRLGHVQGNELRIPADVTARILPGMIATVAGSPVSVRIIAEQYRTYQTVRRFEVEAVEWPS